MGKSFYPYSKLLSIGRAVFSFSDPTEVENLHGKLCDC